MLIRKVITVMGQISLLVEEADQKKYMQEEIEWMEY